MPPAVPNGLIVSYTITYNLTGVSTSVVVTGEEYNITGLNAYSYYYFTVFASTVIGDGPPTQPVVQRTAVARKSGGIALYPDLTVLFNVACCECGGCKAMSASVI